MNPPASARMGAWVRRAGDLLRRLRPFAPTPAILAILVVAASLPSLFRGLHMVENGYAFLLVDMRGIATDFGVGFAAGLLLLMARKANAMLFAAAALFWLAANAGYYEFLTVFGSPFALAQAQYLGDPQFLEGSGLGFSHPWLVAGLTAALLAGLAIGRASLASLRHSHALAWAVVIAPIFQLIPASIQVSEWRQSDFVSINLVDVAKRVAGASGSAGAATDEQVMPEGLRADLGGTQWLKAAGKPNVLIVFVESISGGHIPAIAATAGVRSTIEMPRLSRLTETGIVFTRFVTQQNQSNRGLYAALCGDLPELAKVIPKMSRIANGVSRPCLPAYLGEAGYASVFIKSADSNFMQMRDFGLKIGFDRVYGEEAAPADLPRGPWGLSDDGLYSTAIKEMEAMGRDQRPWFMALFTSGTHHPFKLRPGAVADGQTDRERAWDFADRSIEDFVAQLRARGILDNTLVILTSDEAGFVNDPGGRAEEYLYSMLENWGYVLALAPHAAPASVNDYFSQSDLPISVLDYLGLGEGDGRFNGRSMFRHYTRPREIAFGAVYHRRTYLYETGSGDLTLCDEQLTGCRLYRDEKRDLFSPRMRLVSNLPKVPDKIRAYQAYSLSLPEFRNVQIVPQGHAPPS